MAKNKSKAFRLSDRVNEQIAQLVSGGHASNETAAITEAVNSLYHHRVIEANQITLAHRKASCSAAFPEMTKIDGKLWLNLGGGLLADAAAAMLLAQFPEDVELRQNALEEWQLYHKRASQDAYALFRAVIMFRFE